MKRLPYALAAIGVATVVFTSNNSIAETSSALDQLLSYTALEYFGCSMDFGTAEKTLDSYGSNSFKTKDAYKEFYEHRDKAERNAEVRFAAVKQELASKVAAEVALKELYIYWRAEMAPCFSHKKYDIIYSKFRLLLERVRVEASW
jgi:hypothetical protein